MAAYRWTASSSGTVRYRGGRHLAAAHSYRGTASCHWTGICRGTATYRGTVKYRGTPACRETGGCRGIVRYRGPATCRGQWLATHDEVCITDIARWLTSVKVMEERTPIYSSNWIYAYALASYTTPPIRLNLLHACIEAISRGRFENTVYAGSM